MAAASSAPAWRAGGRRPRRPPVSRRARPRCARAGRGPRGTRRAHADSRARAPTSGSATRSRHRRSRTFPFRRGSRQARGGQRARGSRAPRDRDAEVVGDLLLQWQLASGEVCAVADLLVDTGGHLLGKRSPVASPHRRRVYLKTPHRRGARPEPALPPPTRAATVAGLLPMKGVEADTMATSSIDLDLEPMPARPPQGLADRLHRRRLHHGGLPSRGLPPGRLSPRRHRLAQRETRPGSPIGTASSGSTTRLARCWPIRAVEVLDIAVPPDLQPADRARALRQRHVRGILAQKPLAIDYRRGRRDRRSCADAGITLAVNQNMRYDQSVRALQDAARPGLPRRAGAGHHRHARDPALDAVAASG